MRSPTLVRALHADWVRHGRRWSEPALWVIATYRYGHWADTDCPRRFAGVASHLYGAIRMLTEATTGVSIPSELVVGEGLHLIHAANIRIHPGVVIGDRVGIMHDVTIGTGLDGEGAPVIGDDVFIGPGAKIVGPIRIGAGARIAANSLVVSDVPAGATAIGVPARAVPPMQHRRAA